MAVSLWLTARFDFIEAATPPGGVASNKKNPPGEP
jgi:hypothetical protein